MRSHASLERKKILICGSDQDFIKILVQVFSSAGYNVNSCYTGSQALILIESTSYHLILLDEKSTGFCELQLLKQIREFSQVPTIVLSSDPRKEARMAAFFYGADDYLLKPFLFIELEARVEAAIRRYIIYNKLPPLLSFGNIQIDMESKTVSKDGEDINLHSKEYETLLFLIEHEKQILTPKQIYEAVWGKPYPYDNNTVATTIWRIRTKLKSVTAHPVIQTVKGIGYRLVE